MSAPSRARHRRGALCDEGGNVHTWESNGLDVNDLGVLVNVRTCLRCDASHEKPYGAGGSKPWSHRGAS